MVDSAGPWTVRVDTGLKVVETKIHVMIMVDSCTNWPKLALIPTENSIDCAKRLISIVYADTPGLLNAYDAYVADMLPRHVNVADMSQHDPCRTTRNIGDT